jgi:hypothetical protein
MTATVSVTRFWCRVTQEVVSTAAPLTVIDRIAEPVVREQVRFAVHCTKSGYTVLLDAVQMAAVKRAMMRG